MVSQLRLVTSGVCAAFVAIAGCSGSLSFSPPTATSVERPSAGIDSFSYAPYHEVLQTYVNADGLVDYPALQANRQQLDAFNASLATVSSATYESWSEAEKIAFLINAYNSFTLQSIIDQNPLKASIRDISGVWRIRSFAIAGQQKTLDQIEHQTLRTDFSEPRIHAALVCAAISCPILRREPYTGEMLDLQLEEQVHQWLSRPDAGFRIDRENQRVYLSSIFDWFGEDWIPAYRTAEGFTGSEKERAVLNFISQYVSPEDREYLLNGDYAVKYLDYDWSLNIQ